MILDSNALQRTLLIILDGFGEGKDYPFNAITRSSMPFYQSLRKNFGFAHLQTSGLDVGLPTGIMGNSEVGHMNMGAGRIIYQDLTRINQAITHQEFESRFLSVIKTMPSAKKSSSSEDRLHLMGLFSDGGVHSHQDHFYEVFRITKDLGKKVYLHLFTDGRDTPPESALAFISELQRRVETEFPHVHLASMGGRYYALDRDQRWERVEKAYKVLTGQSDPGRTKNISAFQTAKEYLQKSYAQGITDEFIEPLLIDPAGAMREDDFVFFLNFRSDRARELTRALIEPNFAHFPRLISPQRGYFSMTQYQKEFSFPVLFPPERPQETFPQWLSEQRSPLGQFRIAETEKYAHVTFFFNGGREAPFSGENRLLIPSPRDVATHDLKPQMSAYEVTEALTEQLTLNENYFYLVNFANPDMVGHTGNFEAAQKAMECIDTCLEKVIRAAFNQGIHVVLTSDHGNVEEMREYDHLEQIHTQHTLNPVPFIVATKNHRYTLRPEGRLCDVAPTLIQLMGAQKPSVMTGQTMIQ